MGPAAILRMILLQVAVGLGMGFFSAFLIKKLLSILHIEEETLLMGASDLPLSAAAEAVRRFGGVPVPAHINRGSNGLLVNLGFIPPDIHFTAVEVWRALPCSHSAQAGRVVLHSSDAHYLGDILEPEISIPLEDKSVEAFLYYLTHPEDVCN